MSELASFICMNVHYTLVMTSVIVRRAPCVMKVRYVLEAHNTNKPSTASDHAVRSSGPHRQVTVDTKDAQSRSRASLMA